MQRTNYYFMLISWSLHLCSVRQVQTLALLCIYPSLVPGSIPGVLCVFAWGHGACWNHWLGPKPLFVQLIHTVEHMPNCC